MLVDDDGIPSLTMALQWQAAASQGLDYFIAQH